MKTSTIIALVCIVVAAGLAYMHHAPTKELVNKAYASINHLLGHTK